MAPRSFYDVPGCQRGKFESQRLDGSVVIKVPSGFSFILSAANVASTGMEKLLSEGLRQNEVIYWTTRAGFEGPEIDQIYCDRLNNPRRRFEWIIISCTELTIAAWCPILQVIIQTMEAAVPTA